MLPQGDPRGRFRTARSAWHVPGTCRALSDEQRAQRRAELSAQGRVPALRLRAEVDTWTVHDEFAGEITSRIDDVIVKRGGNQNQSHDWAYNLAVVVDDGFQHVDQVVRGDDLLMQAPAQGYLAHVLGLPQVTYAHVPLVLNSEGQRLAKRDGAVTLRELCEDQGAGVGAVIEWIGASVGVPGAQSMQEVADRFSLDSFPRRPVTWSGVDS